MKRKPGKFSTISASLSGELTIILREWSSLYGAGITLTRQLEVLSQQASHSAFKDALAACLKDVQSGHTVSSALRAHPDIFPALYVHMVEIGERSGTLDTMLLRIAELAERSQHSNQKLVSSLIYPIIVMVLCLLFIVIVPAFLFRGLFELLENFGVSLPILSRFLLLTSTFIRSPLFPLFLLCVVLGIVAVVRYLWRSIHTREALQRGFLALPALGKVIRLSESARFARTLSVILNAGVPLLNGLDMARRSTSLIVLQETLELAHSRVSYEGVSLGEAFADSKFFPPLLLQFFIAGEESGNMSEMLSHAAEICEQDVECTIESMLAALQPMILLLMGVIVGLVITATMIPMLRVLDTLG